MKLKDKLHCNTNAINLSLVSLINEVTNNPIEPHIGLKGVNSKGMDSKMLFGVTSFPLLMFPSS